MRHFSYLARNRTCPATWTHTRLWRPNCLFHWWASRPYACCQFRNTRECAASAWKCMAACTKVSTLFVPVQTIQFHIPRVQDGPISYSMMDGQMNGRFGDLVDESYDGWRTDTGFLSGGLGQLVDGIKGDDNYKVNKGYEWIGWRANSHHQMSIVFEFADIRNFTLASFHCNNMFSKEMTVFRSTNIWFSLDGKQWAHVPEDFEYMPDTVVEKARDVVIHLHHRIGRFIRFDLKFGSKWLLLSEVRFFLGFFKSMFHFRVCF